MGFRTGLVNCLIGEKKMSTPNFEESFSDFIDRREYDDAQNALFSIVRLSYQAGWEAACGKPLPSQQILRLLPDDKQPEDIE